VVGFQVQNILQGLLEAQTTLFIEFAQEIVADALVIGRPNMTQMDIWFPDTNHKEIMNCNKLTKPEMTEQQIVECRQYKFASGKKSVLICDL